MMFEDGEGFGKINNKRCISLDSISSYKGIHGCFGLTYFLIECFFYLSINIAIYVNK